MGVTAMLHDRPSLSFEVAGVTFTVAFDRADAHQLNRMRYYWEVSAQNVRDYGDDLTCVGDVDLRAALESLIVFAECGDTAELFPNLHAAGLSFDDLGASIELGGEFG